MSPVLDITIPADRRYAQSGALSRTDLAFMQILAEHGAVAEPDACTEAERVTRIAMLEKLKNTIAAVQSREIVEFARAHAASQTAAGDVEPAALERSIAGQIGLACGVSPTEGRKRMRIARDLRNRNGHDHVRGLFATGQLSEYKTATIVGATSHLDPVERAEVDRQLAEHHIEKLGVGRIRTLARSIAAAVAPEAFAERCRTARGERRVSIRPAADGMADVTAHLPIEQAVACYAALNQAVKDAAVSPEPVLRSRGQIMADTFVERLTGQKAAGDVNVEVQILVPVEALLDPDSPLPAQVPGHGPVPTSILGTGKGRRAWRRLFTRNDHIIGGDPRRRLFTGVLAELIAARDRYRCREPFCDAPIRHTDHITPWAEGGDTTFVNGRGLCVFHNLVRDTDGSRSVVVNNGMNGEPHTIRTTTATGHTYLGAATTP